MESRWIWWRDRTVAVVAKRSQFAYAWVRLHERMVGNWKQSMPNSNFSRGLRAFGSAVCNAHDAGWARNILGTLQRFVSDHAGIAALLDNRSDTRYPSQAVSTEKRSAQKAVVVLLFPQKTAE
jgi:hypothetical protein